MKQKLITLVSILTSIQFILDLVGFYNFAASSTDGQPLFGMTLSSLAGISYWSVLSMVAICGAVISVYMWQQPYFKHRLGILLTELSCLAPLVFAWFLIIPATLSLLALLFLRLNAIEDHEDEQNETANAN